MSRTPARITQADVARALRAAEQVAPGRLVVEITADGAIRIIPHETAPAMAKVAQVAPAKEFVL